MTTTLPTVDTRLARRSIATIRGLVIDMVERAGNGHVGTPLALAPLGYVLFRQVLRVNPADPGWLNRDRLVLSAGHASAWLYALLHLTGHPVGLADLRAFRQLGSITPGHPEYGVTAGVEATSGPLGQGLATAVGMALGERLLAERFNRPGYPVVDHRTIVVASDGDLMEGVSQEAISLAGQLGLGKLIVCYDNNGVTIDGPTRLSFDREDTELRFRASGWRVLRVRGFDEPADLAAALDEACVASDRPALVVIDSEIGYPAEAVRGTPKAHGGPLGAVEARRTKALLGLDPDRAFGVSPEVCADLDRRGPGAQAQRRWTDLVADWGRAHPRLRATWDELGPAGLASARAAVPRFEPVAPLSPRNASSQVMASVQDALPTMVGGAADLVDSTKTWFPSAGWFTARRPDRNIPFGVREHAMAAAVNGLALHGGLTKPYGSTFLAFSDYMRPAVRLSAVMRLPVLWIWSHDSIAIGPDGPTHQAVEHLASLRAIPGLWVIRPCDANETAWAWRVALDRGDGPVALVLARQALPNLPETAACGDAPARGGYVLWEPDSTPQLVLLATGSEVHLVLAAARRLRAEGAAARVVSLPCWELFEQQDADYRERVLPRHLHRRVAVEAASPLGWHRWVGTDGEVLGMRGFGASAPGDVLQRHFGFTVDAVVAAARRQLER
jgi:transketolase